VAPGDTVWASDLDTLERCAGPEQDAAAVAAVAAKYLINEELAGV